MDATTRSALHTALQEHLGAELTYGAIQQAEAEYDRIVSSMAGGRQGRLRVAKWPFVFYALNAVPVLLARQPIFESTYLTLLAASVVIGLSEGSISAFRAARRLTARRQEAIAVVVATLQTPNRGEAHPHTGQAMGARAHGRAPDMARMPGEHVGAAYLGLQTVALPADLVAAVDQAVQAGQARSRTEWVARALQQELAAQQRAILDAASAARATDPASQAQTSHINHEPRQYSVHPSHHTSDGFR